MLNALPLTFAAILAFGPGKPAPKATPTDSNADPTSFVLVENNRNVPVEVFVETADGEQSLGMAGANAVTPIRLDAAITSMHEASFLFDPRVAPVQASGKVQLTPGKGVEIQIPRR